MSAYNSPTTEEYENLERLIDRVSIGEVLEMIGNIAYEKADHVFGVYADKNLGAHWNKFGDKIHKLATWTRED